MVIKLLEYMAVYLIMIHVLFANNWWIPMKQFSLYYIIIQGIFFNFTTFCCIYCFKSYVMPPTYVHLRRIVFLLLEVTITAVIL